MLGTVDKLGPKSWIYRTAGMSSGIEVDIYPSVCTMGGSVWGVNLCARYSTMIRASSGMWGMGIRSAVRVGPEKNRAVTFGRGISLPCRAWQNGKPGSFSRAINTFTVRGTGSESDRNGAADFR